jgi:hypothetical protein
MSATVIACPCGAVKIELRGEPLVCLYCHCDDCQAVHGAAYLPAAIYRSADASITAGEPGLWRRKTTARAFCRDCGTRLFAEPQGLSIRSIVASLLPEGVFRPAFHMQCRYARLPVRDGLPHYKGEPAMMGGSDEVVDW